MEGRGKFDTYTAFWRDVERAREDFYFAQQDREGRGPGGGEAMHAAGFNAIMKEPCT